MFKVLEPIMWLMPYLAIGAGVGLLGYKEPETWGLGLILLVFLNAINGLKESHGSATSGKKHVIADLDDINKNLDEISGKLGCKEHPLYGLDDVRETLEEMSDKLGHKNNDMTTLEDLAKKLDEINATLEEIKSNTNE